MPTTSRRRALLEKSRLIAGYLERSLALFRRARDQYASIFEQIRDGADTDRIVLVGGGELAEIAVLAAFGEGIPLLAIIHPGANIATRYGVPVAQSLEAAGKFDIAIITDLLAPQDTYEALRKKLPEIQIFAPDFLRITPNRAELLASRGERRIA